MANEAVIVELFGEPKGESIKFTCADGAPIEKGALLWFSDPNTVSGASITVGAKPFAGIASTEKGISDGSTHIGCWTKGIFDLTSVAAPTITAGDLVYLSGQNLITRASDTNISGSNLHLKLGCKVGIALEDSSASEVIQVRVG